MLKKLTVIDDLTRPDHCYLSADDDCAFYGEYVPRQGFTYGPTNDLIINLKKSPLRRDKSDYRYKLWAIDEAAANLKSGINAAAFPHCTFVPVPPSKARDHPEYDDRMLCVAQKIVFGTGGNVCEIVTQRESYVSAHATDDRPDPSTLCGLYDINESACAHARATLIVLDDVLTTGSHFVAMKRCLLRRFPDRDVRGLFVARRVLVA